MIMNGILVLKKKLLLAVAEQPNAGMSVCVGKGELE